MFKKKFHNSIDKGRYGYLFIAPFFIVFAVFGLYPIVYTFINQNRHFIIFLP